PSRRCVRKLFRLQVAQGAQRVLPRHLLAPLVDAVGVVECASFDVSRLTRRPYLIVFKWLPDQCSRGFFDLDWRRCDTAEDHASVCDRSVVSFYPRRDPEHGKIESPATA